MDLSELSAENQTLDQYSFAASQTFGASGGVIELDAGHDGLMCFGWLLTDICAGYITVGGLEPDTLYGVRFVVSNGAGRVNGSVTLLTTLLATQDFTSLEFDADFVAVFGIELSNIGWPLCCDVWC